MGLRKRQCVEERHVVALFTGQEVAAALLKAYPGRFPDVPDQTSLWFSFVEGGMAVEVRD
jgi:hypothetical protein